MKFQRASPSKFCILHTINWKYDRNRCHVLTSWLACNFSNNDASVPFGKRLSSSNSDSTPTFYKKIKKQLYYFHPNCSKLLTVMLTLPCLCSFANALFLTLKVSFFARAPLHTLFCSRAKLVFLAHAPLQTLFCSRAKLVFLHMLLFSCSCPHGPLLILFCSRSLARAPLLTLLCSRSFAHTPLLTLFCSRSLARAPLLTLFCSRSTAIAESTFRWLLKWSVIFLKSLRNDLAHK